MQLSLLLATALATASAAGNVYPPSTASTFLGCECKSACKTGLAFDCYANPYCIVKDKQCAKGTAPYSYSRLAYYDYCTFPAYKPWEEQSAAAKHAAIMSLVKADKGSGSYPSTTGIIGVFQESVNVTMVASADVFPQAKRTKFIHSVGAVAPFRWVSSGSHNYTGLFRGAEYGVIRLSSATAPSQSGGMSPGAGIKLFRDGVPSANFMAMPRLTAQSCAESTDFFANNFSNHVPSPGPEGGFALELLAKKFWQGSSCPLMVGISHLAGGDLPGIKAEPAAEGGGAVSFPYQLQFVGRHNVTVPCGDYKTGLANLQSQLKGGDTLFDVFASSAPRAAFSKIGRLDLTDAFVTSKFGDEKLFFKHLGQESDFRLRPEWLNEIDHKTTCGMDGAGIVPPDVSSGCSSPFPPSTDNEVSKHAADMLSSGASPCPFATMRRGANAATSGCKKSVSIH